MCIRDRYVSESPGVIVTPEAVRLDFETAGIATRGLAALIDIALRGALMLASFILLPFLGFIVGDGAFVGVLFVLYALLVLMGYPIAAETIWGGRTLGKLMMGTRVVTLEGVPIRFRHAFIRGIILPIDLLVPPGGALALMGLMVTKRHQRLGDLAAGTYVIRNRQLGSTTVPIWFTPPAGWEDYARSLDVSRLTDHQYTLVRTYLLRTGDLHHDARAKLSLSLATRLAAHMHHQPPPGLTADHFLLCSAAALSLIHI